MSGSTAPDAPPGRGGLVVIIREDPVASARLLAAELRAEIAIGGEAAMAALDALPGARDAAQDLEALRAAMRRAERVRERTRAVAASQLARTLNTDLAIHPDTLHRAAEELLAATDARQIAERGRSPSGRVGRLLRWLVAAGIVASGVALALMDYLVVGLAVAALGVVSAVAAHVASRRAIRATLPALQADEDVARRRWEQVAGSGADPTEVEAVIYRYDPRHRIVADLVGDHPAVRAAERVARIHRDAWVRAWCSIVGDPYEPPEDLDELVAALDVERASAADVGQTLVVAAPYAELTDPQAKTLHQRLLTLSGGPRVIVVLGTDSRADRLGVVDLTRTTPVVDLTDAEDTRTEIDQVAADTGAGRTGPPLS